MNDDHQSLIDGYLDDCLSPEDSTRLNLLLKADAGFARRFARAMLLHDRLHTEHQASAIASASELLEPRVELPAARRIPLLRGSWAVTSLTAIAATVVVGFFFWHAETATTASAASVALDRMIEAASQPVDRVYRIRVTDPGPAGAVPQVFSGKNGRKPGVDGAELYVRGSDKFVLVRHFADGTDFITGSDGALGWAVAPRGHVHLSRDVRRFRRAVPGEHEEIPFTDMESGFSELRRAYDLKLAAVDEAAAERADAQQQGWSRLDAVKRRPGRSPGEVRIWFDSAGVAHRIELLGLSQDDTGPRAVALELIEQRDLGPEFFKHESHHGADRPLDWE
jgi:hypothetical protein